MIQRTAPLALSVLMMCGLLPAAAQERAITLAAPDTLVESGFLKFLLPRFSLKNSIRVQVMPEGAPAQVTLGTDGSPVFAGRGVTYRMDIAEDTEFTQKFAEWLGSDAGMAAVTGFVVDGSAVFGPAEAVEVVVAPVTFDGDVERGEVLSFTMCGRCHVVGPRNRMAGIGSTPSFAVMKTFTDWQDRFSAFYVLNPHPAFTQIEDVTPPFDPERPPAIVPVEMTLDDLESILAYVARIAPAELGAPIRFD